MWTFVLLYNYLEYKAKQYAILIYIRIGIRGTS